MSRGKVARASILTRLVAVDLGIGRERRRRVQVEAERAEAERRDREGIPTPLEIKRRNPDGSFYTTQIIFSNWLELVFLAILRV
jgi:hypothetical protein